MHRPSLEKDSDQLIVKLSIYPSVHNHLIRTLFEARPVDIPGLGNDIFVEQ